MTELSTADLAGGGTSSRTADDEVPAKMQDRDVGDSPARGEQSAPMATAAGAAAPTTDSSTPLFPTSEAEGFRSRWQEVQTGFVDEPRSAVERADGLVAEMMQRLAQVFADEQGKLEEQWSRGDDISTEDLRVALQRYRSFMDRLLAV
jgi:hypothetical protein